MRIPIAKAYVLKIFLRYLLLSLAVFVALMVMVNLIQIVNSGALVGFSFYFLGKSILFMLPSIIGTCLPFGFLLAVLLSLGQMSQEGEIIAMRAGGYSFFDIFSWVFTCAAVLSILLVLVNNWAGPKCLRHSTDYARYMLQRITKIDIKPKTFQNIADWTLYADTVNGLTGEMNGVKLIRRTNNKNSHFAISLSSDNGYYRVSGDKGMSIQLYNGEFTQTESKNPGRKVHGIFTSYETVLPFFAAKNERNINHRELTTNVLRERLKEDEWSKTQKSKYKTEIVLRMVLPFGPLLFFFVGAPLAVALDKRGKSAGFSLSILILFFYYGCTLSGVTLARKNDFLFPWIIWAPTLIGFTIGALLWKKRLAGK